MLGYWEIKSNAKWLPKWSKIVGLIYSVLQERSCRLLRWTSSWNYLLVGISYIVLTIPLALRGILIGVNIGTHDGIYSLNGNFCLSVVTWYKSHDWTQLVMAIYRLNSRDFRGDLWLEIGSLRVSSLPWMTWGDFNILRFFYSWKGGDINYKNRGIQWSHRLFGPYRT